MILGLCIQSDLLLTQAVSVAGSLIPHSLKVETPRTPHNSNPTAIQLSKNGHCPTSQTTSDKIYYVNFAAFACFPV
jgi:hypothetical protein